MNEAIIMPRHLKQMTFLHRFLIYHCVGIINVPYEEEKEGHVLKVFLQMCRFMGVSHSNFLPSCTAL